MTANTTTTTTITTTTTHFYTMHTFGPNHSGAPLEATYIPTYLVVYVRYLFDMIPYHSLAVDRWKRGLGGTAILPASQTLIGQVRYTNVSKEWGAYVKYTACYHGRAYTDTHIYIIYIQP